MKNIYAFIIMTLLSNNIVAQVGQKQCNCCTAEYQQFDFWLGEWEVYNLEGVKVGENNILHMQGNCVIQENWTSVAGHTGTSYNFYNNNNNTWNQTWIDNSGTVLQLQGVFENNRMILKSEKIKSQRANYYYTNRIIWTKDTLGNVLQKWEIIGDDDKVLQVVFDGIYKRKSSSDNSEIEKPNQKTMTIIEFVKTLNNKSDEALYFYENNWRLFREVALNNKFIQSYQLIKSIPESTSTFDIILITEYSNDFDYQLSEERFQKIIKETRPTGPILLNEIKPNEFRQSISVKKAETIIKSN